MKHTTGLTRDQIRELCAMIHREIPAEQKTWPPVLGLFRSVVVALTYLRRNRVQAEIAETSGVSQPTISRAITATTPLIETVLRIVVPTADDLRSGVQYIVDGTLLPTWSWDDRPELYSGKHKTTGVNVQVAATLDGQLAWISDPVEGRRHDTWCLREAGVLTGLNPADWIGDKGYVGNQMITPIKKRPHLDLTDGQKQFNTAINKIRYVIEQAISHLKNWWILKHDYRRPFDTFETTIAAVIALQFWKGA